MDPTISEHNQHYAPSDIESAITAALAMLNKDNAALSVEAFAGMDQFHTGGLRSTRVLAKLAGITASDRVLDVGGGLGGPARILAQDIGCQVTVLDLTEAYCRVGEQLTAQVKLADLVHFKQGNALEMPFEAGSFDVVWTQHSSMNIPDKTKLYAQIHRVLRLGGRLALHEVTAGNGEAIRFPTMWAHNETMSFLVTSEALRTTLNNAGFRELTWNDVTEWSISWFQERQQAQQNSGTPSNPIGLQLLLGPDFNSMIRNHVLNLQDDRIRIVEGVLEHI